MLLLENIDVKSKNNELEEENTHLRLYPGDDYRLAIDDFNRLSLSCDEPTD